jgi:mono/diheme cytochrome c family protein
MLGIIRFAFTCLFLLVLAAAGGFLYVRTTGLRSQAEPGTVETRMARAVRALAVPSDIKTMPNPVARSSEAIDAGKKHFARYCSVCHGNEGTGVGAFSKGLFPKPPDMRQSLTQELTDGELFYIIENGVRFTGMPAFGSGTSDPKGETLAWQLVHFIRHLPSLTNDEIAEMESLNPL